MKAYSITIYKLATYTVPLTDNASFFGNYPPLSTPGSCLVIKSSCKRCSKCTDAHSPPSKRTCLSSSTIWTVANRIPRRIIVNNYGKTIYKESSRISLFAGFEQCINGYQSFHSCLSTLQRDISIDNLMVSEDAENLSWPAFLIDLDLAVKERQTGSSGANGKTDTMFTLYYQPLIPYANRLRREVLSNNGRWRAPNLNLHTDMTEIIQAAQADLKKLGGWEMYHSPHLIAWAFACYICLQSLWYNVPFTRSTPNLPLGQSLNLWFLIALIQNLLALRPHQRLFL